MDHPTGNVDEMLSAADVGIHIVPGTLRAEGEAMRKFNGWKALWVRHRVRIQGNSVALPGLEVRMPVISRPHHPQRSVPNPFRKSLSILSHVRS